MPVGAAALPRLPAPNHHVRFGAGLFIHRTASAAGRPDAEWLAALAQHRGDTMSPSRLFVATMIWLVGIGRFRLPVHLPIMLLAASAGVWLFYVQHQFENTVWAHDQAAGIWKRRRFTAALTMPSRVFCAGSQPISAFTTSIIYAAEFPTTGCRTCCASTRISTASVA